MHVALGGGEREKYFSRFLLNHQTHHPQSTFDTHPRWQLVTHSAQSRRSYGKIGDCQQSTRNPIRETVAREAPPRGPTLHPFIYHFSRKTYPFRILSITKNDSPFTYLVQNFASLLIAVNALSFKQESITKIERFLDFMKP